MVSRSLSYGLFVRRQEQEVSTSQTLKIETKEKCVSSSRVWAGELLPVAVSSRDQERERQKVTKEMTLRLHSLEGRFVPRC
jgi:hypothetical protein